MPIITLSRQFGCGGEYVAERVADILGYRFISKEIIQYIAILTGHDESTVQAFDEEEHSGMKASVSKFMDLNIFKDMFSKTSDDETEVIEFIDDKKKLYDDQNVKNFVGFDSEAFAKMVERVVSFLVNEDNVIILGRGGQCLLQDEKSAIHIRLFAPIENRVTWVQSRERLSIKEANSKIIEIDRRKMKFLKHYYNAGIDDPNLYHLLINLEKSSLDEVSAYIANSVKVKFGAD